MLPLLTIALIVAAPEDRPSLQPPRLQRGDELVYLGEVVEAGERVSNRFRKKHELEVRLFVLDAQQGTADCAVMTVLRTPRDPIIAAGGTSATIPPPAVHLELVRIDSRGRIQTLHPPAGPPPLSLASSELRPLAPLPVETAPLVELGMILALPAKIATVGETWETAELGRPPVVWSATKEAIWNGSRVVEVAATQQTDGWDRPTTNVNGWKRTDTLLVAPTDGYASRVSRRIERRTGNTLDGWIEVRYELQPPKRHVGPRYEDVRQEVEIAYGYNSEITALLAKSKDTTVFTARQLKLDRHLEDRFAVPTGFRVAVEATRRRCEAAARGDLLAPAVVPVSRTVASVAANLGKPAPDFVAPLVHSAGQYRLSAGRGAPVVLVFYKPGSTHAEGSLQVAEALAKVFGDKLTVAALTVSSDSEQAKRERDALRVSFPVADGTALRAAYGIEYYPQFLLVDRHGSLAWRFEGFGGEVGYLVKREVEKLLK